MKNNMPLHTSDSPPAQASSDLYKLIIATARSWLGTPFLLHGRSKDLGCDCIGLVVGVARQLQLQDKHGVQLFLYDTLQYSMKHHQKLPELLPLHLYESVLDYGVIAVMSANDQHHLGIVGDYVTSGIFTLIHACVKRGAVVEHRLTLEMQKHVVGAYSFISSERSFCRLIT